MATVLVLPRRSHVHLDAVMVLSCAAAVLLVACAWTGIRNPVMYAQETPSWRAQATGQDWVNLLLLGPLLAVVAVRAASGSRRALLMQGGLLAYVAYSAVIYAVGVHFNALFLVYCALLGTSFHALTMLLSRARMQNVQGWFTARAPWRTAGVLQVVLAAMFAALWLAEDLPALARGVAPAGLADAGLVTNPVHVLDLALALPVMAVSGVAVLRRRALGYLLTPIMLGLGAAMTTAMAGMVWFMAQGGVALQLGPVVAMVLTALTCTAVLGRLLWCVRSE
jgi:hypothetical protein